MTRLLSLLLAALLAGAAGAAEVTRSHGIAMHGELKYGPDFRHFEYANPDAPKGGDVRLHAVGAFDSLNLYILKGDPAQGLGGTVDPLMVQSNDEPFSMYGLVAESVEVPEDRSWITFHLRPEARFHDGTPITADDVVFTFETLREDGHPFYRSYYKDVAGVRKLGPRAVRFDFGDSDNPELPLILGQLPVLPKAYWEERDFSKTTLEPPLGSGPYRVKEVEPGRSITYERVEDYWARDLPVARGRDNFDTLRYDYYRDATVTLEAFKAGEYDFRLETTAKDWATAYDFPALRAGLVKREEIHHERPQGMQAYFMNTRRELFQDRRVRRALGYAFDFEWTNRNIFNGAYTRTRSYFSNSELAARGLPGEAEREILAPYRDRLPPEVFTQVYEPPSTDGSGNNRANLRTAIRLLKEAGWTFEERTLVHGETGEPFAFEILLVNPMFERVTLPFVRNLERLGIDARVRVVDATQYQNRLDNFDFDMVVGAVGQSLSPGNEQHNMWHSSQADVPGSNNLAGVRDPVVDALVEKLIRSPDRETLVNRTRALDRVLLWGHYVIPHWHIAHYRVAYWDKFDRPEVAPRYDLGFDTWWVDPDKARALRERRTGE